MDTGASTPSLTHLLQLAQQLEQDREASLSELRKRDHEIGKSCTAEDDSSRLLHWLHRVVNAQPGSRASRHESAATFIARSLALLFGFLGILLALPVAAALNVLVRHVHQTYRHSDLYKSSSGDEN